MSPNPDEVREWLQNAKDDLFSAQILIEHAPPVLDTACFHCQQAVEKLLKAFLVWKAVYSGFITAWQVLPQNSTDSVKW